tara:strand:+ start:973 stop:1215 length:243 start_codon:yes stop_codon:yes gene_type:complete
MKSKNNFNQLKLKEIISKILKINLGKIPNNLNRDNCKNWDSMNHVRLILEIEKEFGFKIDNNDAIDLVSLETLVKFLDSK